MTLTIPDNIPLDEGINKVIREEENFILTTISSDADIHEKIHEVRKSLKKLRAAVRLVRKISDRYKEENIFYRDLGRKVSVLRDKTALLESLQRLRDNNNEYLYQKTFSGFHQLLLDEREKRFKAVFAKEDPLEIISHQITQHLREFKGYDVKSFADIKPGIGKVYRRGKQALSTVKSNPSTEDFHEWRKRTKYLRYQLEMLMQAWPHMLSAWEESLHQLSDYLGDDHDLAILQGKADSSRDIGFKEVREWELLNALINYERKKLQEASIETGSRIYLDSPEAFAGRMESLWNT